MSAYNLHGQVAVITGASSGIGHATALALTHAGVNVVLAARTQATLDVVVRECSQSGVRAVAVPTDVSNEQEIVALMDRVVEQFGQLDILVTSAGGAAFDPIMESRTEDWDMLMNVNLRGTYLCCKNALKHMLPRKSGHILNVLSIASHMILPGSTAYTASQIRRPRSD